MNSHSRARESLMSHQPNSVQFYEYLKKKSNFPKLYLSVHLPVCNSVGKYYISFILKCLLFGLKIYHKQP